MSDIKLNTILSPEDQRDFQAEAIFPADISLPEVFDPRKEMLPVRTQGLYGTCVGEASACMKEYQEKNNIGFKDYFSPQFIYNLRENPAIEGMNPRNAMKIMKNIGIVAEEDYPYGNTKAIPQDLIAKASNYKINSYAFVNTIQTLKTAIYKNGPCMFTVPVYNFENTMWRPKSIKILLGYHAFAAVGWNKDGFILRNSYGSEWGDNGYIIFPYSDWGLHSEIWTIIDDNSSKPDPKYSKWYWKAWRSIKNIAVNMGFIFYMAVGIGIVGLVGGFWQHEAWMLSGACWIFLILYSILKKSYLIKDK
jgi:hypothetical protein